MNPKLNTDSAIIEIDARGLACPAPVLQTRSALEKQGAHAVKVTVDNQAAQQNVQRFLESRGFETVLEKIGQDFRVKAKGRDQGGSKAVPTPTRQPLP